MGGNAQTLAFGGVAPQERGAGYRSRAVSGFTLIELVVVVIILGILAAIIVPRYLNMAGQAREEASTEALAEGVVHFNLAFMKYVVNVGSPPSDLDAMSGEEYLDLSGGGVVAGEYRFSYAESGTNVVVGADVQLEGGWTPVKDRNGAAMTRTIPWPCDTTP